MSTQHWSPFDPKWYQAAFDRYTSTSEELFNTDLIIQQGFHVPDSDGSRNSVFFDDAVLNNTFNESDVRSTLTDIYLNSSHKLAAFNHDNTHFYQWHGTMSDFKVIPNTDYCQMEIPIDTFIAPGSRNSYKMKQFYRKWISVQDILNNWDVFGWHCFLFIDHKVMSEYILRMDDHVITIKFKYVPYWYKQNFPVYIIKMDTNAQCRIKISRELCENQWDWKVPLDQLTDHRILNSKNIIVAINKIDDPSIRKDGVTAVDVLGDNLEFLTIRDGCIDLSNISQFNKNYIRSELRQPLWMSIIVPKFFHEYPIILPADVVYRPYEANFQKVSVIEGDYLQHVKADVKGDRTSDQIYVDLNEGNEMEDGWAQMIRPIVLADAYDGEYSDPYVSFLDDLRKLRDATVRGADLIEDMRYALNETIVHDGNLDTFMDQLVSSMTEIHDMHNSFMDKLLIEYNQDYDAKFKRFLEIVDIIKEQGTKSEWLNADQKSQKNFWNMISPLVYIPRALVDKYNVVETTSMVQHDQNVWNEHDGMTNQFRYRHPVAEEDFWIFEYDSKKKVWRPTVLTVKHQFPDVYLLSTDESITGRVFKAFFFYSDTINVTEQSTEIEKPDPSWDKSIDEYHVDQSGTMRDIFMEKFYWMGVRAIYRGYLLTNARWEALEYVMDNNSYRRFNELFLKTIDPYFKLGMATYLKNGNFNFPFDDAIEKLQEAMGQVWLNHKRITNFEMYLEKNCKPSYFDAIVDVRENFKPEGRLVRRPPSTLNMDRILPYLLEVQTTVHKVVHETTEELDRIIAKLKIESYHLNLDLFLNMKQYMEVIQNDVNEAYEFANAFDPKLYSNDDIVKLIDLILRYLELVENISSVLHDVEEDTAAHNHHKAKHESLDIMRSASTNLPPYIENVMKAIDPVNMMEFMEGSNELRTYLEHDKNNPDDNSLLGYINKFDDPWTTAVKDKRDTFFQSSAIVFGSFIPERSYSLQDVEELIETVKKCKADLGELTFAVTEFYRVEALHVDQTIIDRIQYTDENLDTMITALEKYVEAVKAFEKQCAIIIDAAVDVQDRLDPTDTENGYIQNIIQARDDIRTAFSYIAASGDRAGANRAYTSMMDEISKWTSFVDEEEQWFIRIEKLVKPPVQFVDELDQYRDVLNAIIEYLRAANLGFIPDPYLMKYSDVYKATGITITSRGFHHKVPDEAFFQDLGTYRINSIQDDLGRVEGILPTRYRCTTFRDPMVQELPYDSITSGEGLGLLVKPTGSSKTPIVCDDVLKIIMDRISNIIFMVSRSARTPNKYDNENLERYLLDTKEVFEEWADVKKLYGTHISDHSTAYMDHLINELVQIDSTSHELIESRKKVDIGKILEDAESFVNHAYETAGSYTDDQQSEEQLVIDKIRELSSFYGNGSSWSDIDEAIKVIGNLQDGVANFHTNVVDKLKNDELDQEYALFQEMSTNMVEALIPTREHMDDLQTMIQSLTDLISHEPEYQNDVWYKIDNITIATSGKYYHVGDVVKLMPQLPEDENGNPITDQEDIIMDDIILVKVLSVGTDGIVTEVCPLMQYAIPYQIWGLRETAAMMGDGRGLVLDIFTSRVAPADVVDYTSSDSDTLKPAQYGENDLVAFRFENIHDLDIHYDVFVGGKQVMDYIQRHEKVKDVKHPRDIDVIYLRANSVMGIQNASIYTPPQHYLIYRIKDIDIKDSGAGYCEGQQVFVDAGSGQLRLIVDKLTQDPMKGIQSIAIASGNVNSGETNPAVENASLVPDTMNNIDDEYHVGYYEKLPPEGIQKPATFGEPESEYPFISKRFDDLEDGDPNKTFLYPDVKQPGDGKGDPDTGWYAGSRIDNSQVPEEDPRIFNGIQNVVPPTHPFIPDALRTPPGQPIKGDYQKIMDICLRNTGEDMQYDLVVDDFQKLPRDVEDWADGKVGSRILVTKDNCYNDRAMVYTIRTFVAGGWYVYDFPEFAKSPLNTIDVDWMDIDSHPDMPTQKAQYPTAPYDKVKTYKAINREIADGKHEATNAPEYIGHTSYIHDLTVDDLSVFNWTTHQWEDLHDESRWKLIVSYDDEKHEYGFSLELLQEDEYIYEMSVYLNKTADSLSKNVPLIKEARLDITTEITQEVNIPASTTTVNTSKHIRIRKLFPYEQKETFICNKGSYEMNFKMAPYIHYRNEIHLEDIIIYNKTAGRYEDILDSTMFEVQFKDPKAKRRGMETHTIIERVLIGNAGSDFVDGEAWAYNAQYGIHVFGTVKSEMNGDGHIVSFTPVYCPNPPDEDADLEFSVYQNNSQTLSHAALVIVEFKRETVELFGDGYIHHVRNRMAPVPEEFKVVVQYDLDEPTQYEIIIDKTAKHWEFVYSTWSNTPTFRIKTRPVPKDRIYIVTDEGRMPIINPSTGGPSYEVTKTSDGFEVTLYSLYRRYDHIHICVSPYPMRSVYTQRDIPVSGYIDLKGKLNKPLNKRYYEFWVNGKLLYNEVTIITPTKLFLHGLTSLKNLEIVEVNRDPNEYFSNSFLEVITGTNGRPYQSWNFQTYLDDALEGNLGDDNYTIEEQEYLLTPVWKQVDRDHPEFKNYPPNIDSDPDILVRVKANDNLLLDMDNPLYQYSIVDSPTIEGQRICGRRLTFEQFGFIPISDDEIVSMLNEEWKEEIEDGRIKLPSHSVMDQDQWYGMVARLYDENGIRVNNLNLAVYTVFDHDLLKINGDLRSISIMKNNPHYDLD